MTRPLTLYYAPGACSIASHIARREAQIPFDFKIGRIECG